MKETRYRVVVSDDASKPPPSALISVTLNASQCFIFVLLMIVATRRYRDT